MTNRSTIEQKETGQYVDFVDYVSRAGFFFLLLSLSYKEN